jgi:hypothetical protein
MPANNRVDEKLDRILEKISSIDVTLIKQHASLAEHIRRTEILEEKIKPIEVHMTELKGIVKLLKLIGIFATIVEVLHLWKW